MSAEGKPRNRYDLLEWAGAFGDLGTLIPFAVAYIAVVKMDPSGILFAFGIALVVCGLYYRTPFPVQPMKAIGAVAATQAAQTFSVGAGAVYAAGLATGIAWLALGLTGVAGRIAKLVGRPVLVGIVLGLGMSFMFEGAKMMSDNWYVAAIGFAGTLLLLGNNKVPAMFVLLLFGFACSIALRSDALSSLASARLDIHWPTFALGDASWRDLWIGTVFLALPQLPLTLGNAVLAITEENNRLFPDRRVRENGVAVSTGLLNVFSAGVGGVPMCHGAGGMAGHVRFGARTGGAPVILGAILVVLALFFGSSVEMLFKLIPLSVLGVILFLPAPNSQWARAGSAKTEASAWSCF